MQLYILLVITEKNSGGSIFIDFTANYITTTSQLKIHDYNKGYKDIKVVTRGSANFKRDCNKTISDRITQNVYILIELDSPLHYMNFVKPKVSIYFSFNK